MKYQIICAAAYVIPKLKDAEEAKKLILKDDENTFVKIRKIK